MAKVLNGKKIAKELKLKLKKKIATFTKEHNRKPGLEVVLVGDNEASIIYTKNKQKTANSLGIRSVLHTFPKNIKQEVLLKFISHLNTSNDVDGILIQLPLPKHINCNKVINAINPSKDVDGFHPTNVGLLCTKQPAIIPCTPKGIMYLLDESGINLAGKHVVVINHSNIIGKPLVQLLLNKNATVTIAHSYTHNLNSVCKNADVLITATGCPKLIKNNHIKEGAVVIDVGINRLEDNTICGDVDFENVKNKTSWITPVPGGVGPMTIACLMENTLFAAEQRLKY